MGKQLSEGIIILKGEIFSFSFSFQREFYAVRCFFISNSIYKAGEIIQKTQLWFPQNIYICKTPWVEGIYNCQNMDYAILDKMVSGSLLGAAQGAGNICAAFTIEIAWIKALLWRITTSFNRNSPRSSRLAFKSDYGNDNVNVKGHKYSKCVLLFFSYLFDNFRIYCRLENMLQGLRHYQSEKKELGTPFFSLLGWVRERAWVRGGCHVRAS